MIVAIPVNEDHNTVCISFGRAPKYLFFDSETGQKKYVSNDAALANGGAGIQAAQFLVDNNAEILLTPRCGENAAKVLNTAEIKIYKTTSEDIEEELKKYKEGLLNELNEIHPGFHNHH